MAPSSVRKLIQAAVERHLWATWAKKGRSPTEEEERREEEASRKRKWTSQEVAKMRCTPYGGYRMIYMDWKPWAPDRPWSSVEGHPPRNKTAEPEGLKKGPSRVLDP